MNGGEFLETESMYSIMAWRFAVWYFLSVIFSKSLCISAVAPSLISSHSFAMFFIYSAFLLCSHGCHTLLENYYYYYYLELFTSVLPDVFFYWSLSDRKSPQISRTRLWILAVLSNALISIASTCPPTSTSSRFFNNLLVIVPKAPITIGTIVTFLFHNFFNSQAS